MASVNKVILLGNVGNEPELFYVEGTTCLVKFALATEYVTKSNPITQWHKVAVWGEQGEQTIKHIHKGDLVFVEGRLQYQSWQDKQGNTQREVHIVAALVEKIS